MKDQWIDQYLTRIQYDGKLAPNWRCLQELQSAHLLTVPFEDLDIHLKTRLSLDQRDLFKKVVLSKRGGFCYELNHLFGNLLMKIGFQVEFIAAQVHEDAGQVGDYFDHMALKVNNQWLVDVGFGGGSFLRPLSLENTLIQHDDAGDFQIRELSSGRLQLLSAHSTADGPKPLYNFDLLPQSIFNFEQECLWKQEHPDSHFVKNKICTIATKDGRKSILNDTFTQRVNGEKLTALIPDRAAEKEILKKHFGIII